MSGIDYDGSGCARARATRSSASSRTRAAARPAELAPVLDRIAREGGTPLAVARDSQVLGVVYLKDTVKEGMSHRFDQLRAMGIRTVMVTGDNRLTAAKIAEEAGVDDFLAEATPERKLELIRDEQAHGRLVAMTGDGTNDAPALAQADVGVAMNTGTQAAREAGNMVDLDSNPTKLIEIVEVGKQLLITRGALTTFSIANDVAKYFAILPAIFVATYAAAGQSEGPLATAQRDGPRHAAVGDHLRDRLQRDRDPDAGADRAARRAYRAVGATALLRRNLLIYGVGGLIAPFVGIKLIDLDRPQPARGVTSAGSPQGVPRAWPRASARPTGCSRRARGRRPRHASIGLLETHGRAETAALAEGLELLPRRDGRLPRHDGRGDGPARDPRPRARSCA